MQSIHLPTSANTSGDPLIKAELLHMPLSNADREDYPPIKYWYRHEWTTAEHSQVAMIGAPGKA